MNHVDVVDRYIVGVEDAQTTRIYGLEITNSNGVISFTRKLIQERIWQDKMYFYPIAQTERYNNRNLIQNIGWN